MRVFIQLTWVNPEKKESLISVTKDYKKNMNEWMNEWMDEWMNKWMNE